MRRPPDAALTTASQAVVPVWDIALMMRLQSPKRLISRGLRRAIWGFYVRFRNILFASAMLATSPAEAATLVQNFSLSNTGSSFVLQQFDSSLGTLESVDVFISALARRNLVNPEPGPGANIFSVRGFVNLTSIDAGAPVLPGWQVFDTENQSKFNSPYELMVGGPNQTTNLTSGLSSFTGMSSFSYLMDAGIDIFSATAPYGATLSNTGGAAIRVTYNFTEAAAAVPEPSIWAMMLAGFGLIGFAMRRQRHPHPKARFAF